MSTPIAKYRGYFLYLTGKDTVLVTARERSAYAAECDDLDDAMVYIDFIEEVNAMEQMEVSE